MEAWLEVAPEVGAARAEGRPVVALESTLISHGLPYPQNPMVARASEAAVRESGAVPATVAIHDGRIGSGSASRTSRRWPRRRRDPC
jgi:pseudouridine-5'-phosphate glycosidase